MATRRFRDCRAHPAALFAVFVLLMVSTAAAHAQKAAGDLQLLSDRSRLNSNTVGIVTGTSGSVYLAAAEDMAAVLDDGYDLRVMAMLGKGAVQNVSDILSLQNTDMGITQANVLSYLKKQREFAGIENKLRYLTKLFNEEVHIVAQSNVIGLAELNGKTVNFGEPGSGSQLTAQLVFEALGINVTPVNLGQADALIALQEGRIAATVLVAGKPTPIFDVLRLKGDLRLLPIPYEEALEADYLPTQFTHADYPTLVPEGQVVETVAVPAVLAVFNWRRGTDRYRRVETFAQAFFEKFEQFRKPPRHPKWREVNLTAELPGWQRFEAAQKWLDSNVGKSAKAPAGKPDDAQRAAFRDFMSARKQGDGGGDADQEALFRQFLEWMNTKGTPAAASERARPAAPTGAAQPAPAAGAPAGQRLW